jgi:hypothetical protein
MSFIVNTSLAFQVRSHVSFMVNYLLIFPGQSRDESQEDVRFALQSCVGPWIVHELKPYEDDDFVAFSLRFFIGASKIAREGALVRMSRVYAQLLPENIFWPSISRLAQNPANWNDINEYAETLYSRGDSSRSYRMTKWLNHYAAGILDGDDCIAQSIADRLERLKSEVDDDDVAKVLRGLTEAD